TSDVVMTFFFLASVGAWWRHLEHPGLMSGLLSAAVLSLAFVAKFSAVLLPPMLGLIALVWLLAAREGRPIVPKLIRLLRTTAGHVAVVLACIWLFYGFRFSAFAPGLADGAQFYRGDWAWILSGINWTGSWIVFLRDHHLLPEAWLYGLTFVIQFSQERGAFL